MLQVTRCAVTDICHAGTARRRTSPGGEDEVSPRGCITCDAVCLDQGTGTGPYGRPGPPLWASPLALTNIII
jgi:hypothetical protein